jgi:hypothetical protein
VLRAAESPNGVRSVGHARVRGGVLVRRLGCYGETVAASWTGWCILDAAVSP